MGGYEAASSRVAFPAIAKGIGEEEREELTPETEKDGQGVEPDHRRPGVKGYLNEE